MVDTKKSRWPGRQEVAMMILIRHTKRKGATETIEAQRKERTELNIPKKVEM